MGPGLLQESSPFVPILCSGISVSWTIYLLGSQSYLYYTIIDLLKSMNRLKVCEQVVCYNAISIYLLKDLHEHDNLICCGFQCTKSTLLLPSDVFLYVQSNIYYICQYIYTVLLNMIADDPVPIFEIKYNYTYIPVIWKVYLFPD